MRQNLLNFSSGKFLIVIKIILCFIFFSFVFFSNAQDAIKSRIVAIDNGEKWYGATVVGGGLMPFKEGYSFDLNGNTKGNQAAPLLLSTSGRYLWSNSPFAFTIN